MKFRSYVIFGEGRRELALLLKAAGEAKGLRIGVANYDEANRAWLQKLVAENDAVIGVCYNAIEAEELRAMGLPWKRSVLVQPHWESGELGPVEMKRRRAEGMKNRPDKSLPLQMDTERHRRNRRVK